MTRDVKTKYTPQDAEWATTFENLYLFLKGFPNSEQVTLLLSTCRNAYMTVNALFVDLQVLLGDAQNPSGLRGGCELLSQGRDAAKARDRFGRAKQTVMEFESKLEVWNNRHALLDQVHRELDKLTETNPSAGVRLAALIDETRVPDADLADGWSVQLFEIDPAEQPHLQRYFDELSRLHGILKVATLLGLALADAIREREPEQIDWIAPEQLANPLSKKADPLQVWKYVAQLADACGWNCRENDTSLFVHLSGHYDHPSNTARVSSVTITKALASAELCEEASLIADVIRQSLYLVHFETCDFFRPNVGKAPMPDIFQISIPPPARTPMTGYPDRLEVKVKKCSSRVAPSNSVKIALAHLAVPVKHLNVKTFRLDGDVHASIVHDVRAAVVAAAAEGCKAVVFPEYSLPKRLCDELLQLATDNNVVVIGGLEGEWLDNRLRDCAVIAIPGERSLHLQVKQVPSREEPLFDLFYHDETLHLFTGTPIGDFSVVVCSDFMELTTVQAWKQDGPLPDTVFLIARNEHPELYKNLAQADALRIYTYVAISNVLDQDGKATNNGSLVATPDRNKPISEGHLVQVPGKFRRNIDVHTIELSAICAGREDGKSQRGFFSAPRSAQRA